MAALAQSAREHIKRARLIGKSLDLRMAAKVKAAEDFTLNEDDRRDFKMITEALQHGGKSLEHALEAEAKANAGKSDEQLTAQFQAEIVKAAATLNDEDWALMCDARRKAGKNV
jgi:hypothetical protein